MTAQEYGQCSTKVFRYRVTFLRAQTEELKARLLNVKLLERLTSDETKTMTSHENQDYDWCNLDFYGLGSLVKNASRELVES